MILQSVVLPSSLLAAGEDDCDTLHQPPSSPSLTFTHTHSHREVCRLRKAKQRADIKKAVEILNSMDSRHVRDKPESTTQEDS